MKSGKLRHKIYVQNPSEVSDAQGGADGAWSTHQPACWASVEPLSTREQFWQSQLQTIGTHKVTMRYTALITSRSRILFGTRTFEIAGVLAPRSWELWRRVVCVEVL